MLQLLAGLCGLFVGARWGTSHFGVAGGVIGALMGGGIGSIFGYLPWCISWWWAKRQIQSQSSEQLRQELRGERYYVFHLFLATLMMRGENIQDELGGVVSLLRSASPDERQFGWHCLQFAYPGVARQIGDYDPKAPAEVCRTMTDAIIPTV